MGAAGPTGPQGLSGAAGAKGEPGGPGSTGSQGAPGKSILVTDIPVEIPECNEFGGINVEVEDSGTSKKVCNGEEGEKGVEGEKGEPWTPDGTLPVGATETGAWVVSGTGTVYAPISFTIKTATNLTGEHVHFGGQEDPTFHAICPGSFKNPAAPTGELCVYENESETTNLTLVGIFQLSPDTSEGAARAGAVIKFTASGTGFAVGSWAVTG
jgi:hypothetical protein